MKTHWYSIALDDSVPDGGSVVGFNYSRNFLGVGPTRPAFYDRGSLPNTENLLSKIVASSRLAPVVTMMEYVQWRPDDSTEQVL